MSAIKFIQKLARKLVAQESKGITKIPTPMAAESKAGEIAAILQNAGLPFERMDEFIKSEKDLVKYLNIIESTRKSYRPRVYSGQEAMDQLNQLFPKKGEVFDMTGKRIRNTDRLMGGKEIPETDAEMIARMHKENKEATQRLKQKMKKEQARTKRISGTLREENTNRTDIGEPKLSKDEYDDYAAKLGENAEVDYYPVKGDDTREQLESMVKEAKEEEKYMKRLYDKGALDDPPEDLAGGGIAGMLGEPTYEEDNHRVPLKKGKRPDIWQMLLDTEFDDEDPYEWENILRSVGAYQDGGRIGYANGTPNIKFYPKASGIFSSESLSPEVDLKKRNIDYGLTTLIEGDKFFGGAELGKGKIKVDVVDEGGSTYFKDTISKPDAVNFILGMGDPTGNKFQVKTDKDFENMQIILKSKFKDGGRIPFSAGGFNAARRLFLKMMGAGAATAGAAKSGLFNLFKGGKKQIAKEIITTPSAPGKPEWFDPLVTRIIREGDDVSETMATKERQIIHRKKIDDETEVIVTQDLDEGVTRVDIDDATRNVAAGDDQPIVSLQVTDEIIEEGGARTKPQFTATENDYRNYMDGPDDYTTEFVENTVNNTKDLTSDLTKVKSYATKKKQTMNEFVESKKRKENVNYANERTSEYAADRGPDGPPDYASGGIARMLGE